MSNFYKKGPCPKIICYDNSCKLHKFWSRRKKTAESTFLDNDIFVINRLHVQGHVFFIFLFFILLFRYYLDICLDIKLYWYIFVLQIKSDVIFVYSLTDKLILIYYLFVNNVQTSKYPNVQTFEHPNVQKSKRPNFWTSKRPKV